MMTSRYRPLTHSSPWWRSGEWAQIQHALAENETVGPDHIGRCDGCPGRGAQRVRTITGPWGAATVCRFHEEHE